MTKIAAVYVNDAVFPTEDTIDALSSTLSAIVRVLPTFLVKRTDAVRYILKLLNMLQTSPAKKAEKKLKAMKQIADVLQTPKSDYLMPFMFFVYHREKIRVPLIIPSQLDIAQYYRERSDIQVYNKMIDSMSDRFRTPTLPAIKIPSLGQCSMYLRRVLLNTPVHWNVSLDMDGFYCLDFSAIIRTLESESAMTKFNIIGVAVHVSRPVIRFILPNNTIYSFDEDNVTDPKEMKKGITYVFFTLVLLSKLCEACYHNWVHFYFNDLVMYNAKAIFGEKHWLRVLLEPHMRYQAVLNHAGMYSGLPNNSKTNDIYDNVVLTGNLTSWSLDTFNKMILDLSTGYYLRSTHNEVAAGNAELQFRLDKNILHYKEGENSPLNTLVNDMEEEIRTFVRTTVERCYDAEKDTHNTELFVRNIMKQLHPDCTESHDTEVLLSNILSRYILTAGFLHGLEHFTMNIYNAPLNLPQRVRSFYNESIQSLDEYSDYEDKLNGKWGHKIFTEYTPNKDNKYNWSSLEYNFEDHALRRISCDFVERSNRHMEAYKRHLDETLSPVWRDLNIKQKLPSVFPKHIGTSICM